jgi:hypothetical protein
VFTRKRIQLPNPEGPDYIPRFLRALRGYLLSLESPNALSISQAHIEASNGIKFPATQNAQSDANTLDDYEEGTWTPVLTFATPGDLSVAYSIQRGCYTKIGRVVIATVDLVTSTFTHTTASGAAQITGLPFAASSDTNYQSSGAAFWQGITKANYTDGFIQVSAGASALGFVMSGSGQAPAQIAAADMPTAGTVRFRGTIVYRV